MSESPFKPGDRIWKLEWPGVVIRVAKKGRPTVILKAPAEQLDAIMERAAREFFDPNASPQEPPSTPASPSPFSGKRRR